MRPLTIQNPHFRKYNSIYPDNYECSFDKLEQLIYLKLDIEKPQEASEDEITKDFLSVLPQIDFKNL